MNRDLLANFNTSQQKNFLFFLLVLLMHLLLTALISISFNPIHFTPHNLFFLELVGNMFFSFSVGTLVFFEVGSIILFWLIGRSLFPRYALLPAFIYSVSPWGIYSLIFGSFYTYLLFLILLFIYGLILIRDKRNILGNILVGISSAVLIYSSLFGLLILVIMGFLLMIKEFSFQKLKLALIILSILSIPYLFLAINNTTGFISVFKSETKVFSDPGIINTVNEFQTSSAKEGFQKISKLSENKYIFFSEYIGVKFLKQLTPSVIFTSEGKLGYFSFTSPIFLGFLIPFIYGLLNIFSSKRLRKLLILSTILVLPSVFALQTVDLNRLLIFSPVIVLIISLGLTILLKKRQEKTHKIFLLITIFLIAFQFLITLYDIPLREKSRFNKYFYNEKNYEISKQ